MTAPTPLKAAVIGAGHLGQFHARVYAELEAADLRFVVDVDPHRAEEIAQSYGATPAQDYHAILDQVDVASIVTPTTQHHAVARDCIEAGVHLLVEKPITATVQQADDLIRLAQHHAVTLQVGHIERFNPAYRTVRERLGNPAFIECHRLSPYPFRSTDVSVVLDLMIHDLDLILDLAGGPPASLEAAGVAVLSHATDIANAHLRFHSPDGRPACIANVTASRISPQPMRRLRLFQPDAYVSIDFLEKKVHLCRPRADLDPAAMADLADRPPQEAFGQLLDVETLDLGRTDALKDELAAFLHAVQNRTEPPVTGRHGRRALALAVDIEHAVQTFLTDRTPS